MASSSVSSTTSSPFPSTSGLKLRLIINTQTQKVIYAEAGKDFVWFLSYLLSLPREIKLFAKNHLSDILSVPPPATGDEGGFVTSPVTHFIMDDLVVKSMWDSSSLSMVLMLQKFGADNVGVLEAREVDFGAAEGVKLAKASLETKNVLTTVFLNPTN